MNRLVGALDRMTGGGFAEEQGNSAPRNVRRIGGTALATGGLLVVAGVVDTAFGGGNVAAILETTGVALAIPGAATWVAGEVMEIPYIPAVDSPPEIPES